MLTLFQRHVSKRLMAKPDIRRILPATAADPLTANAYTFNRILISPRSRGGINASARNGLMILGAYARAMDYLVSPLAATSARTAV